MRDQIIRSLSSEIDGGVVEALVQSYENVVSKYRKGDIEGSLSAAGKLVEHTLRAIEYLRTGTAPAEIKSAASTVREIEKDKSLPESLRLLIPRIAMAMVYDVRSKRGAVHVKEIDPQQIDASLSVQASSWVLAEFLRLYHVDSEQEVSEAMAGLMRGYIPFVEKLGGETVVTKKVPCAVELLLLLAQSSPTGMDRGALGRASKYPPSTVSGNIKRIEDDRYAHKGKDGLIHITGPGEQYLAEQATAIG